VRVVYRGTYDVSYVVDDRGVLAYTQEGQARKNRVVNGLTVAWGSCHVGRQRGRRDACRR
jgi:hypothetical protein